MDGECSTKEGLCIPWLAGTCEYVRQTGKGVRNSGMVSTEASLFDRESAPEESLSLLVPVTDVKYESEAIKRHCNRGMVWTNGLLLNRQCPSVERFGFIQPIGGLQQLSQAM